MNKNPLSIYVHIPFCAGKCRYCDFYSVKYNHLLAADYIQALVSEWDLLCSRYNLAENEISTIYFGGGTPSILPDHLWEEIFNTFISKLNLNNSTEFSVECNPESFSDQKAFLLNTIGVNRLTFGIQSLSDRELSFMGRVHSATRALEVLNSPSLSNFRTIGADLIYGIPGQSLSSFADTLIQTLSSPFVNHLSAYELTINTHTPFGRHHKILPLPEEDETAEMMQLVRSQCIKHGFEQYEISNFSKPLFHSRHNEAYWDHRTYIGLGCAAHSYLHPQRWSNQNDVILYMKKIAGGELPFEEIEKIDPSTLAQEMIFLGLRRTKGIDEIKFEQNTGMPFSRWVNKENLEKFISLEWIVYDKPYWRPTEKGLLFADGMAVEL